MSTFDVNNVSPVRNAEGTFAVSNAMFHNASIVDEQEKLKQLFETEFNPALAWRYDLAELKVRFEQMLVNIDDLMYNYSDMECYALYHSSKSLQSVSKMFQEMLLLEFNTSIIPGGVPMAQSSPDRHAKFNQTMQHIFPGGAINNATYVADPARNLTFNVSGQAAGGNATFVRSRGSQGNRSRSRNLPEIFVESPPAVANADQSLSNSARILNQTMNQLITSPNPANMTYLTVPSRERHRTLIRQASSQIPVLRSTRPPPQRKLNFSRTSQP